MRGFFRIFRVRRVDEPDRGDAVLRLLKRARLEALLREIAKPERG